MPSVSPPETSSKGPLTGGISLVALVVIAGLLYWFWPASEPADTIQSQPLAIGVIYFDPQHADAMYGFKEGMDKLGYTNVTYDDAPIIAGASMIEDMNTAIQRMLDEQVNALWVSSELQVVEALRITKERNDNTPIVYLTRFHDPVEYGIADSYRTSGNNATGIATDLNEIVQKELQFLKEIDPDAERLGLFSDGYLVPEIGGAYLDRVRTEAPKFGFQVIEYTTNVPPPEAEADWYTVADNIQRGDIDAIFHIAGHFYERQEMGESELAIRLGIPMAAPLEDMENGGTFAYTVDFGLAGEQSAVVLDKILHGTKPEDIPIAFGSKTILALHLGRAREAGITFPGSMLFIAQYKFEDDSEIPDIFR